MRNYVATVADRIQNAILTAIDIFITSRMEVAVKSINASSGLDSASVTAVSEYGEQTRITASFENAFHELSANDEAPMHIPDEVSEFSVARTHLDCQSHTHHKDLPTFHVIILQYFPKDHVKLM